MSWSGLSPYERVSLSPPPPQGRKGQRGPPGPHTYHYVQYSSEELAAEDLLSASLPTVQDLLAEVGELYIAVLLQQCVSHFAGLP